MNEGEWVTVPYLAKLTGIGETTIWKNIRLLQSVLREEAQKGVCRDLSDLNLMNGTTT